MLAQLSVKNFSLIDQIEIDFTNGLTVITGETGAGKSILLGALSLILGERANHSALKNSEEKCVVEGIFNLENKDLSNLFEQNDLDFDSTCVIRREITPQGKSRSFINDTPVTLDVMKLIGDELIDIHSQHQSLQINNEAFQLELLDSFSNNEKLLEAYSSLFLNYKKVDKELAQKIKAKTELEEKEDFLNFQYNELEALSLKESEVSELENEQNLLANSEEVIRLLASAHSLFSENEANIISQLASVKQNLSALKSFIAGGEELDERMKVVFIELQDISSTIESQSDNFQYDPQRHSFIDDRLAEIYRLQRKHQLDDPNDLLKLQDSISDELNQISISGTEIERLELEKQQLIKELTNKAIKLRDNRLSSIAELEKNIVQLLQNLGIPNAAFKIDHQILTEFTINGIDGFTFLFSANKGVSPQKVAATASGGEISRLMLSLKSLIAKHKQLPTIIFDEIDTGVSGEIADKMGEILKSLGTETQVFSITHLPQIAAKGKAHLFVFKADIDGLTQTRIKTLTVDDRVLELAKMLSGKSLTDAAINNAKELLEMQKA